jgi:hypothetical protein
MGELLLITEPLDDRFDAAYCDPQWLYRLSPRDSQLNPLSG